MSILFRSSFKTAAFSRFVKVAIARSNVMNEAYEWRISPQFSVSMLKETIALVQDYVFETRR